MIAVPILLGALEIWCVVGSTPGKKKTGNTNSVLGRHRPNCGQTMATETDLNNLVFYVVSFSSIYPIFDIHRSLSHFWQSFFLTLKSTDYLIVIGFPQPFSICLKFRHQRVAKSSGNKGEKDFLLLVFLQNSQFTVVPIFNEEFPSHRHEI